MSSAPTDTGPATGTWAAEYDWIVVGSGGGGMTAALAAHHHGLTTLIVEKSGYVGGSTARSGGCVWIPNNHIALARGCQTARNWPAGTWRTRSVIARRRPCKRLFCATGRA